jgi:hypothetical protein
MIARRSIGGVRAVTGFRRQEADFGSKLTFRLRAVSVASADTLLTPQRGWRESLGEVSRGRPQPLSGPLLLNDLQPAEHDPREPLIVTVSFTRIFAACPSFDLNFILDFSETTRDFPLRSVPRRPPR